MNERGNLEQSGKPLSELCAISESQKTFQGIVRWNIPNCEMKKYLKGFEKCTRSNTFSIGSPSFCSFHFLFHPNISDNEPNLPAYLNSFSVSIIFNAKVPDSAWITGKIHFDELDVHEAISVSGKDFQKKIEVTIPCYYLDIYKLKSTCESDLDFTMHCSLKMIIREVKCAFDKQPISYAESRNYDSSKDIFRHDFSDATISIGNHQIMTHKVLLAQMPYFQELFDANESEKDFELTNIDHEVFNYVLTYLYSGDIPLLSFKLACELYIVAGDLKIPALKNLCSSYLGANITVTNVVIVLRLSHDYEDSALKKECFKFIKRSDVELLTEKSMII